MTKNVLAAIGAGFILFHVYNLGKRRGIAATLEAQIRNSQQAK